MSMYGGATPETDADFTLSETKPAAYQSPLLSRLQGSGKLTLQLLAENVPVFHAGEAAKARLAAENLDPDTDEAEALRQAVRAGEYAKETLVLAGIPLIKHLAKKEFTRRTNWQSAVTYEDLVQEGSGGFIRGLRAYKVDGNQKSATNYLGQWVLTDMRRNVETIDNDFGVAYDAAERFRKIRAIRSRLASSLGREPTDEEMLEAASDPAFRGGSKIGRVAKNATVSPKRQLTQAQLNEERELRGRVGHTQRFRDRDESDDATGPTVDHGQSLYAPPDGTMGNPEDIIEEGAKAGLARLLTETFRLMRLPGTQQEVIARRFALPPHEKEQSARDISRDMNLHRERVGKVVEAFTEEMSRPGGTFHRACGQWDPEDLADLGLGWTLTVLGDWNAVPPAAKAVPLAAVLTEPLLQRRGGVAPPTDQPGRAGQVYAQFACDYHGWGFVGGYGSRSEVPKKRACPRCGQMADLVRVMES